jgi:hypothetical protein
VLVSWVSGLGMNKGKGYECTVKFPEACSITVGTPVRVRSGHGSYHLCSSACLPKVHAYYQM